MLRVLLGLALTFVAGIVLLAFLVSGSERPRADIILIELDEDKTLDPQTSTGVSTARVLRELYEPLMRDSATGGKPEPGMSVGNPDVTNNGRTYTFTIRDDNYWVRYDQEKDEVVKERKVTARDYLYSWLRVLDPKVASEYNYQLFYIKNAEAYYYSEYLRQNAVDFAYQILPDLEVGKKHAVWEEASFQVDDYIPEDLEHLDDPLSGPDEGEKELIAIYDEAQLDALNTAREAMKVHEQAVDRLRSALAAVNESPSDRTRNAYAEALKALVFDDEEFEGVTESDLRPKSDKAGKGLESATRADLIRYLQFLDKTVPETLTDAESDVFRRYDILKQTLSAFGELMPDAGKRLEGDGAIRAVVSALARVRDGKLSEISAIEDELEQRESGMSTTACAESGYVSQYANLPYNEVPRYQDLLKRGAELDYLTGLMPEAGINRLIRWTVNTVNSNLNIDSISVLLNYVESARFEIILQRTVDIVKAGLGFSAIDELYSLIPDSELDRLIREIHVVRHEADATVLHAALRAIEAGYLLNKEDVKIDVPDDTTLVMELKAPTPFMDELLSFSTLFAVPRTPIEMLGRDWKTWIKPENIWTNGAYVLKEWEPRYYKRVVKNPFYHEADRLAQLETVDYIVVNQPVTQLNTYLVGNGDFMENPPNELAETMLDARSAGDQSDFLLYTYFGTYYYRFNVTLERVPEGASSNPFADPKVRQAFVMSIDREFITREVTKLGEIPHSRFVPSHYTKVNSDGSSQTRSIIPGYYEAAEEYRKLFPDSDLRILRPEGLGYNPKEAQRLLSEAGLDVSNFPKVELLYNTNESHRSLASAVRQQWMRNLGFPADALQLVNLNWPDYLREQQGLNYDISRAGWIGDYLDANTFLDMFKTGGGNNQTGWGHPTYDLLIDLSNDIFRFIEQPELIFDSQHPNPEKGFRNRCGLERLVAEYQALQGRIDASMVDDAEDGDADELKSRQDKVIRTMRFLLQYEAEFILVQDEVPIVPIYIYQSKNLFPVDKASSNLAPVEGLEEGRRYKGYFQNYRNIHPVKYLSVVED